MAWAVAHVAYSRPDAEVIAALLRNHGIENFIAADDPTGPELAFVHGIEVRIHEEDLELATEILRSGTNEVI